MYYYLCTSCTFTSDPLAALLYCYNHRSYGTDLAGQRAAAWRQGCWVVLQTWRFELDEPRIRSGSSAAGVCEELLAAARVSPAELAHIGGIYNICDCAHCFVGSSTVLGRTDCGLIRRTGW